MISVLGFCGCTESNDVIRIHIRANSNSVEDQSIKLVVRDNIIEYITPLIEECDNSSDVKKTLKNNLDNINNVALKVLRDNGYDYDSNSSVVNEYFPSRNYDGQIFDAGYYDALIINLGSGSGNNWWCVAYPPLCFVGDNTDGEVQYKSKIVEMIEKYFGK